MLDPVADKLLMDSLFLTLAFEGHLPPWIAVLVIARDLLIVAGTLALRYLAGRFRVEPLFLGKISTFMQIVLGGAVLLQLSVLPGLLGCDPAAGDRHRRDRAWPRPLPTCSRPARIWVAGTRAAVTRRARRRRPGEPAPAPCQLVLDLPHAAGDGLTDFMPAASNREALDAVLGWPAWPAHGLSADRARRPAARATWPRSGRERAGAVFLRGPELWEPAEPLRRLGRPPRPASSTMPTRPPQEVQLFHLWNRMVERGGSLLLTARSPGRRLGRAPAGPALAAADRLAGADRRARRRAAGRAAGQAVGRPPDPGRRRTSWRS